MLIYMPPDADPAKKYPVVYLADGNARLEFPGMIEPLILSGQLPPMILVALWPGNSHKANEDRRSEEYLTGWPEGTGYFLAHESFLLKEVMPYVEQSFGASSDPKDRIVSGFSSGAAWAISMGERHPDIFPTVIAQSLVWGVDP
ncbi:MAG TPA: alpha/beta hydrolase-fold protein, partial [Rhizomicrobium sp.]